MTTKTDINELAQRLREAAEKATKGLWHGAMTQFNGISTGEVTSVLFHGEAEAIIASTVEKRDAEFIALANPVNIQLILDALEAAQRQVVHLQNSEREWEEANSNLNIGIKNASARIKDLESNNKNLVERCKLLRERPDLPVDRIPAFKLLVKAQSRIAELEASQPVVPEGYCLMPLSLTAEDGAKNALNGEFHTIEHIGCVVCGGDGIDGDDECDNCDGSGDVVVQAPVSWTTIKDIYKAAVKCCAIQSFGNSEQLNAAPALQEGE